MIMMMRWPKMNSFFTLAKKNGLAMMMIRIMMITVRRRRRGSVALDAARVLARAEHDVNSVPLVVALVLGYGAVDSGERAVAIVVQMTVWDA